MSAVLRTTALTGKAGAWEWLWANVTGAGLRVHKQVHLPPGAEWARRQGRALQQRAFQRMLPPFLSFDVSTPVLIAALLAQSIVVGRTRWSERAALGG